MCSIALAAQSLSCSPQAVQILCQSGCQPVSTSDCQSGWVGRDRAKSVIPHSERKIVGIYAEKWQHPARLTG
jgi:hypothetical protein